MDMYDIYGEEEKRKIEKAIEHAELNTSGEIRVHIDNKCKENVLDRAVFLFKKLEMNQTEMRNGVLVYLAVKDRKLAIIGDEGINAAVPKDFWIDVKNQMQQDFSNQYFAKGLETAIATIGKKLKDYFPYQSDDINELPNQISFGKS